MVKRKSTKGQTTIYQFLSPFHKYYLTTNFNLTTKITLTIKNYSLGVLDTTLCDKVCQWLARCWWFSLGTLVSSTNKTFCHYVTFQKAVYRIALLMPKTLSFIRKYRYWSISIIIKIHFFFCFCQAVTNVVIYIAMTSTIIS
jgi:hypothetical protein